MSNGTFSLGSFRSMDELYYAAFTERHGDNLLYTNINSVSGVINAEETKQIWTDSSDKTFPTTADYVTIVSTSVNDTLLGTGMRAVSVRGLDENYDLQSEIVLMDGTTPVQTANTYTRVNRLLPAIPNGSSLTNEGRITATHNDASTLQAAIEIGVGISQNSHYSFPRNYTFVIPQLSTNVYRSQGSGRRAATIDFVIDADVLTLTQELHGLSTDGSGIGYGDYFIPRKVSESNNIYFQATAESNNTKVNIAYTIILIKDTLVGRTGVSI